MKKKTENKGYQNIKPPKKGEIRNPNGRPVGSKNTKTILERFLNLEMKQKNPFTKEMESMTVLELMNLKQIANALEGNLMAYKEIIDRYEGKLQSNIDITSNGDNLNPENRDRRIAELKAKLK